RQLVHCMESLSPFSFDLRQFKTGASRKQYRTSCRVESFDRNADWGNVAPSVAVHCKQPVAALKHSREGRTSCKQCRPPRGADCNARNCLLAQFQAKRLLAAA